MNQHRMFLCIAGVASLALAAGPMLDPPTRRRSFEPWPFVEYKVKQGGGADRMTKREKREMMQRDFANGGSRQGRRRRQRLHRCRHKE